MHKYIFTLVAIFVLVPMFAVAQEIAEEDLPIFGSEFVEPAGNTSCFDHYTFGSVQADIGTNVTGTVPGTPITFRGNLHNNNPYPVVDGSLYVKIFRLRESKEKNANGPHVVDQFFVKKKITLLASGSVPIEFQWYVPAFARAGEYQLATFFTSAQKYNLLGLSFTDDVVGNTVNFSVRGKMEDGVFFNKDTVTIGGDKYYFAAFPPRVDKEAPVTIKATITNTTNEDATVPVRFRAHHWDALRHENLLAEEKYAVQVKANSTKDVEFMIEDNQYPVYLAEATLKYKDTKSVINPRFVREGIDRARINYPAVKSYPLKSGEQATLFSCLHNTSDGSPNGSLELTLLDKNSKPFHTYKYTGAITGAMMGVMDEFVPKKNYNTFTVQAHLFQGGELVDEEYITYDCKDFGTCKSEKVGVLPFSMSALGFSDQQGVLYMLAGVAALIILFAAGLVFVLRRRGPVKDDPVANE